MIVGYIDEHRVRFGVEPICRVLSEHGVKIAPSTYYAARNGPSSADLADAYLADLVLDTWRKHREVYGARKMWHQLRRDGHQVGVIRSVG